MPTPQNFNNHMRFDPRFHFFVAPVLLLNVLVTVYLAIHFWSNFHWLGVWGILAAVAVFMTAGLARDYALKNQDRVIRLEESLRYRTLLSPQELALTPTLTLRQIIALRFASDAELPALVPKQPGVASTPRPSRRASRTGGPTRRGSEVDLAFSLGCHSQTRVPGQLAGWGGVPGSPVTC